MTSAERVAAGAAWLDDHDPDWYDRIDLDTLALADCGLCVLGQAFGDYWVGLVDIDLNNWTADQFGFRASRNDPGEYAELDEHWAREITSRRLSAAMHSNLAHGAELRAAARIGRAMRWFGSEGDR